jgi:hypothetical protein
MPMSQFSYFMSIFETIKDNGDCCSSHHLKIDNVHYICNEKDFVHNLTSFKLRFYKLSFSISNIYTDHVIYKYPNYSICINNSNIHLHKNMGSSKAGFYMLLDVGDYLVKHKYTSNILINEYLLLNNKRYGNNNIIRVSKLTNIYFVFDMMSELDIVFQSVSFVKRSQQLFKY